MSDYGEKLRTVFTDGLDDLPGAAPVFGTRRWLEATAKALPFPLKILKVYKGQTLLAYLPLQISALGPFKKAFVPILTFYGGPYFVGERRKYFSEEVKQRYEVGSAMLAFLEANFQYGLLLPDEFDARAALERGWMCVPRYTVINRLKSADSLEFNRAASKSIRKAERNGFIFGPSSSGGEFEAAFRRTFARKGLDMAWKPEWAAGLRRELAGSGLLDNLSVFEPGGREIAFASVALDRPRRTAILWYSCSLAEADQTGAMHFMMRHLLLRYREEFDVFDFCGADHRSLSEFKEKFGQELVVRHSLEKYRGAAFKALFRAFSAARRAAR